MKRKKWIWIAVAAAVVIGGIVAGVLIARSNQEPVFVYGFADGIAGMTDYYDGGNESFSGGDIDHDGVVDVFYDGGMET